MRDNKFNLFVKVIEAAREGRFMYGNGAQWYVVTHTGTKVCIDTTADTTTVVPNYQGYPRTNTNVAEDLEAFLLQWDIETDVRELPYTHAHDMVKTAIRENNVYYTNGSDWYITYGYSGSTVIRVTLGVVAKTAPVEVYNQHSSWCYNKMTGGYKAVISDATKRYMGVAA